MKPNRSFLFMFNIAKRSNFGFLIRTANAFATDPIVIGRRTWSASGAVAGTRRTPVHHFYTLADGVAFAREQGCRITGIEIMPESRSICEQPFAGPTAFMIGNEGTGLTPQQVAQCDDFIYIPQYGTAVSLNINAATAIVLQRFAVWAERPECPRDGTRFQTGETVESLHRAFRVGPPAATGPGDP